MGLLPAEPRFWRATVADHFPAEANSLDLECDALGLDPRIRSADPAALSTGERSRLALLRLLLRRPEVLLLDEPTANLDRENRARVIRRLDRYRGEHRAPVVCVSHLPEVVAGADGVLTLPAGTLRTPGARALPAERAPR